MPIYEYRCDNCGHEFETIQKVSEGPLVDCPQCSEARLKKKVSAAAFRLKGGGWYETDFKSGNKKNVTADGDGNGKSESPASSSDGSSGTDSGGKSGGGSTSSSEGSSASKSSSGGSSSAGSSD